jgi:hypothetical protein
MEITLENLHKFVAQYGEVSIADSTGQTHKLKDGTPDVWDLAVKADRFRFGGRWLNRTEMEKHLDRIKPGGDVFQIDLADLDHMETDPKWKK